jgi:hypothetical protein
MANQRLEIDALRVAQLSLIVRPVLEILLRARARRLQ